MKEELLDRMIKIYGFEHDAVIEFAELIENDTFTDEMLEVIVKAHETFEDLIEEEE